MTMPRCNSAWQTSRAHAGPLRHWITVTLAVHLIAGARAFVPVSRSLASKRAFAFRESKAGLTAETVNGESEKVEEKKKGGVIAIAKSWLEEKNITTGFFDDFILSDDGDSEPSDKKDTLFPNKEKEHKGIGFLFSDLLGDNNDDDNDSEKVKLSQQEDLTEPGPDGPSFSLAQSLKSLVANEEGHLRSLIAKARDGRGNDDVSKSKSFLELYDIMQKNFGEAQQVVNASISFIDFSTFDPTSVYYYLEHEEERKNPSWRRMMHRYQKPIDVEVVNDLYDHLHLAELTYVDTVEDLQKGLKTVAKDRWELVYSEVLSFPGEPSHYIAIKKGQSRWSRSLEVLMVVRGTKNVPDILTNALIENVDYRGGKAHDGFIRGGKFLVKKHTELLEKLLEVSGKKRIKLNMIGHSLGAGAATIAGMEFNDRDDFDVTVTGFGSPALLSKDLSENVKDYVTTVVADTDVVPRASAATVANLALDILEYNWIPKGRRDVKQALDNLVGGLFPISESDVEKSMQHIDTAIDKFLVPRIKTATKERMEPILFPPGTCVHFYRDGVGVSRTYVPCTFFREIDVSRTMVRDHIIGTGYRRIFLDLMRDHLKDGNFYFDEASVYE